MNVFWVLNILLFVREGDLYVNYGGHREMCDIVVLSMIKRV